MHIMYPCEHWKDHVPTPGREALGEISSADTVLLTSSIFALSGRERAFHKPQLCLFTELNIDWEGNVGFPTVTVMTYYHHSGQAGVHSPQTKK